jgi:hypothetical protein
MTQRDAKQVIADGFEHAKSGVGQTLERFATTDVVGHAKNVFSNVRKSDSSKTVASWLKDSRARAAAVSAAIVAAVVAAVKKRR